MAFHPPCAGWSTRKRKGRGWHPVLQVDPGLFGIFCRIWDTALKSSLAMWLKNSWEFDFLIFSPAPMALSVLIAGAILFWHRGRELLSLEQGRNLLMSFVSNAISSAWSVHSFWVFNLPVSSLFIICSFLFSKCWPFLKEECRKRAGFLKKWVVKREVKYHKERGKKEKERKSVGGKKSGNPFLIVVVGEVRKQCCKPGLSEKPAHVVLIEGKY